MSDTLTAYALSLFFTLLAYLAMRIYFTKREIALFFGVNGFFFALEAFFYPPTKIVLLGSIVIFLMAAYLCLFRSIKQINECSRGLKSEEGQ